MTSSGDLLADRRIAWARDFSARGDHQAAADLLLQAIERAPGFAAAWFLLGEARERLDDQAGAAEAFHAALAADPEDRHGAALRLARLDRASAAAMPGAYVRSLFDEYAPRFDAALGALGYRGPEILAAAIAEASAASGRRATFRRALDLGCGTGLLGRQLHGQIETLHGVDLSAGMIAKAQQSGVYAQLHVGDMLAFTAAQPAASFDLIAAADAFVYLADLAPICAAMARALTPDGLVAFTLEAHDADGVRLGDTLRYAHGRDHVVAALAGAGLTALVFRSASTRTERGAPVLGLIVVATSARSHTAMT